MWTKLALIKLIVTRSYAVSQLNTTLLLQSYSKAKDSYIIGHSCLPPSIPFFSNIGKLNFITLNYISFLLIKKKKRSYISFYTLHPKIFECVIFILNYDPYYTLHPNVMFAFNLDGSSKFRVQSVITSII